MRLTDSPEFERVYRQGTAYRGKLFSVHAFPNEHGDSTARPLRLAQGRQGGDAQHRPTQAQRGVSPLRLRDPGRPRPRGVGQASRLGRDVRGAAGGVRQGPEQGRQPGRAPAGLTAAGGVFAKGEHGADTGLPQVPLPHAATVLQVHAELLALHPSGHREVRRPERRVYGHPEGAPLSPVRQGRFRPGKMSRIS